MGWFCPPYRSAHHHPDGGRCMHLLAGTAILLDAARSLPPWAPGRFAFPYRSGRSPPGPARNLAT